MKSSHHHSFSPICRLTSLKSWTATVTRFPARITGFSPTVARKSSLSTTDRLVILSRCFKLGGSLACILNQQKLEPSPVPEEMRRYSPPRLAEALPTPVYGYPGEKRMGTSHVERQNLTMRMCMRRLTSLTNAFSKKWSNLKAALALHFACYNFCRKHISLRVDTPAMVTRIESGPLVI